MASGYECLCIRSVPNWFSKFMPQKLNLGRRNSRELHSLVSVLDMHCGRNWSTVLVIQIESIRSSARTVASYTCIVWPDGTMNRLKQVALCAVTHRKQCQSIWKFIQTLQIKLVISFNDTSVSKSILLSDDSDMFTLILNDVKDWNGVLAAAAKAWWKLIKKSESNFSTSILASIVGCQGKQKRRKFKWTDNNYF